MEYYSNYEHLSVLKINFSGGAAAWAMAHRAMLFNITV